MPMFKKGGKKVPESLRFVPKMADESEGDNVVVPGVPQYETNYTDILPPDRYNTFGKPLDNWEAARLNKSAWDEDYMSFLVRLHASFQPSLYRGVHRQFHEHFDICGVR